MRQQQGPESLKKAKTQNPRFRQRQRGGKNPEVQVKRLADDPPLPATQNARNLNNPLHRGKL